MDTIVFCQEELDNAVLQGCGHIGLCDGKFSLGTQGGIRYTAIGRVNASIPITKEEAHKRSVIFEGFLPEFAAADTPVHMLMPCPVRPPSSYSSSFHGSFSMAFVTSFSGSFSMMFVTSFSGSFSMRFVTSFSGSFSGSFRRGQPFRLSGGSFLTSFRTSFKARYLAREKRIVKEISVNGYGLNLI